MCMMIYHPADAVPFTRRELADFHRRNPHGFGAIWRAPNGEIRWRKGHLDRDDTWRLYCGLMNNGCETMALHWRFATAGAHTYDNCHPFAIARKTLFMHNGVLAHRSTAELSDTRCFADDVLLRYLRHSPELIHSEGWISMINRRIGAGNKLFLWNRREAEPVIVGEEKGLWYNGRWYSNTYAWSVPESVRPRYRYTPSRRGIQNSY